MTRRILLLGSMKLSGDLQKRAAASQKPGLVKPLEPVQTSLPVPEKNLGLWCIANWPGICTTVWSTEKTNYFKNKPEERLGTGTWEVLFSRS